MSATAIASFAVLAAFAAFLALCAAAMAFTPLRARAAIAGAGATPALHFGEHLLRALVGLAFILAAGATPFTGIFQIAGSFLIATSLLIALLPRRWHIAYAQAGARLLPPPALRVLSPLPLAAAIALAWALEQAA